MKKQLLVHILLSLFFSLNVLYGQPNKSITPNQKQSLPEDTAKSEVNKSEHLIIDIQDWEKKKAIFENDKTFFEKNSAALIGILALIISLATTFVTLRNSKKITQMQINASKEVEEQKHKRDSEKQHKDELKELMAQFFKKATRLNKELLRIDCEVYDTQGAEFANDELKLINKDRDEIEDIYYAILLSLKDSDAYKELNDGLDVYMNAAIWIWAVEDMKTSKLEKMIKDLYPSVKKIIFNDKIN